MNLENPEILLRAVLRNVTAEMIFIFLFAVLMLIATMVDLKTGVKKAKAIGQQINSGGLRKTFAKFGDYAKMYYFGIVIDIAIMVVSLHFTENGIVLPVGVILCSLGACLTEYKSVRENLKLAKSQAASVPDSIKEIIACKDLVGAINLLAKIKNEVSQETLAHKGE